MKLNRIGVMLLVIILISMIPAAPLTVSADSDTFYVPEGINPPNSLYSGYWDETGQLITYRIKTPIIRTGWNQDTIGAIIFPNLEGIDQNDLISNATLRLYFDSDLETASDNPSISVWTYAYPVDSGVTLSDFDYNSLPLGGFATNVDLTNVTSAQWVNINVKNQIQALVENYWWESGKGVCFLIYSAAQDTARSYQSNIGLNIPELQIGWTENTEYDPETGGSSGSYRDWNWTIIPSMTLGLNHPDWWSRNMLKSVSFSAVTNEDPETYDSAELDNGDFGEVWGDVNNTYGDHYGVLYHTDLYNGNFYVSQLRSGLCDISYQSLSPNINNTKVMVFGFERTYGTQVTSNAYMGYIAGVGEAYSGSWVNRNSNNAPIVALRLQSYNSTHITVIPQVLLMATASANDITCDYLEEGNQYIVQWSLTQFANWWLGSKYQWSYYAYIWAIDENTGELDYRGRAGKVFNATTFWMDQLNSFELIECYGSGSTDAHIEFYVTKGWTGESSSGVPLNGSQVILIPPDDVDPDLVNCVTNYLTRNYGSDPLAYNSTMIEAAIDHCDPDPQDPSGWEETPYFTRNLMKLYFLIAGLLLVLAPWFYYALVLKGFMKFIYIWIILFLNVIGLALLWHIPSL